jgi:predicted flavoprotein YhiN
MTTWQTPFDKSSPASARQVDPIEQFDVVVVGAGAGGILLLEKTPRIGTKILISGGGKCNVAHAGPLEDVIRAFPAAEARFLRPSCYRLTNEQIMEMVKAKGIELYARPDNRVFPASATAKDVVAALTSYLQETAVQVCLEAPVSNIEPIERGFSLTISSPNARLDTPEATSAFGAKNLLREAIRLRSAYGTAWGGPPVLNTRTVVLSTGGSSYPNSGTTGDGWRWLRAMGHSITPIKSALAPIYLEKPFAGKSGVSVQNVRLRARTNGKAFAEAQGDLLITHQGISGPATLSISKAVAAHAGPVAIEADPLPGYTPEELNDLCVAWTATNPRSTLRRFVEQLIHPEAMVDQVMDWAEIDRSTTASNLGRKQRAKLLSTLKAWPLGLVRAVPLEKGEVVAGGVSLQEVDPQTMASRLHSGLFLCGELLDVAGPVGGYNLQAAFATGYVAGESAAKFALSPGS